MTDIYLSRTAVDTLKEMGKDEAERVLGVLERIRIRPEKYLRGLINDPAYRLRSDIANIYLDMVQDDVVALVVAWR